MVWTESQVAVPPRQVLCGEDAQSLAGIRRPELELALWRRSAERGNHGANQAGLAAVGRWLADLPDAVLPAVQLELRPAEAVTQLQAACDACGTPPGAMRHALLADLALLVERFADIAGCTSVRLRLEPVSNDACWRWHRDCVPLRLITTYRGPGTEWLAPKRGAAALAQPDEGVVGSQRLEAFDVALFKGCGWPGQGHDGGIVHRSPRIAGQGVTRLVLVLNLPHGFIPDKLR